MLGLPSNMCFAADVITVTPLSSVQVQVVVEYAYFSAKNQEPSVLNNATTALLQIASSVQNQQVSSDYAGNPLLCTYPAPGGVGSYDIKDDQGHFVYGGATGSAAPSRLPAKAVSFAIAEKQVPGAVFTFIRKESEADFYSSVNAYIGYTNDDPYTIEGIPYPPGSLLMIRNDSESPDNGRSFIVTRQMQFARYTPAIPTSGTPGTANYVPAQPAIPGWQVGAFYTIQNGVASVVMGSPPSGTVAGSQVAQSGQIPPDASAQVFQIYGTAHFESLYLTGTMPPTPVTQ
jgi:hypothetical protein